MRSPGLLDEGPPDAVVAHFDDIAAGLPLGVRNAGLSTPDDIAVVGYDDGPLAQALDLTTVRQPLIETGRAGAEFLLEAISSAKPAASSRVAAVTRVGRAIDRLTLSRSRSTQASPVGW